MLIVLGDEEFRMGRHDLKFFASIAMILHMHHNMVNHGYC